MTDSGPSPEGGVSDGTQVHRVAAGSRAALGALYDRYGGPAFALASRITGSAQLAEEVVFEVFVELWRDPARYDPTLGGFPSWLLAATHHTALEATRQVAAARRCREALAAETARRAAADGPDAGPDGTGDERACRALGGLPEAQRQALILAYFAGHTQQEIAAATEAPLETVRSRMVNGMRQLRVLLDGPADAPEVQP